MSKSVAVIGAGSWGTALAARLLSENFTRVNLWCRRPELALSINEQRQNTDYLPGVTIPSPVYASADLAEVVAGQKLLVFSVPSAHLRSVLRQVAPFLTDPVDVVNTAKGFEPDTLQRLSEVIGEELKPHLRSVATLSGPNHAEEIGQGMPAAGVISSACRHDAERLQDAFFTSRFRVYTNQDLVGVELGGALKNIIAIAVGIADGMGFGDNTKAMLITRGLGEIIRLGSALGADSRTFAGLAGVGDLIATCTSKHSRNWRAGYRIGQGEAPEAVTSATQMVIEGVFATAAAFKIAKRVQVEMPVTETLHQVLFSGAAPRHALEIMMSRGKKHEYEDLPFGG